MTTRHAVLATGNPHKVEEIGAILGPTWSLSAVDTGADETGTTFEANALIKARAAWSPGETVFAEDSGIVIDALDGAPGIHSARWTLEDDWIPKVLRELSARPDRARTARYVAAAAAITADGEELVAVGTVEGSIAQGPCGDGGFGYDPIFVPDEGDGRTFGELPPEFKHTVSHRSRAFRTLLSRLGG